MKPSIETQLNALANNQKADFFKKFFKTGEGEYAQGDVFLGISVPAMRKIAKNFYQKTNFSALEELIHSPFHEYRFCALLMLMLQYEKTAHPALKDEIIHFYLSHLNGVNNWDLVDVSCYKLLGRHCFERNDPQAMLDLSDSPNFWGKRIAVVGSLYYIKKGHLDLTKSLVINNLEHPHDLMHKANGWMLRELGKINKGALVDFLQKHYLRIPRTTLRYAIERFSKEERGAFLRGDFS